MRLCYAPRRVREATSVPEQKIKGFTRMPVKIEGQLVIRSLCDYCGFLITARETKTLEDIETSHRRRCLSRKRGAAASGE